MINYDYDVRKTVDVSHELLAYEGSLTLALEKAVARVEAIQSLLERSKERRLELEIQSIN